MDEKMARRNFLKAALFGTVAGVAVVKGRAIAGDSNKAMPSLNQQIREIVKRHDERELDGPLDADK